MGIKKPDDVFQLVAKPAPVEDEHKTQVDKSTREILEKIAQVNEKQGLKKRNKPNPYQHFSLGYLRSSKGNEFKFPKEPFSNPILDYVEREKNGFHGKVVMNPEEDVDDDVPEGHYVKRKITHHQTILVPAPVPVLPGAKPWEMNNKPFNATRFELEQQTVDNIKNIVGVPNGYYHQQPLGLQAYHQQALGYQPMSQHQPGYQAEQANYLNQQGYQADGQQPTGYHLNQQQPAGYHFNQQQPAGYQLNQQQPAGYHLNQQQAAGYQQLGYQPSSYYQQFYQPQQYGYNPYYPYHQEQGHQRPDRQFSWNWPGAQYFPITIRDPVVQMYNAVTSMIEYGMGGGGGGGGGGGCKNKPKTKEDEPTEPREVAAENVTQIPSEPTTILEIEDLRITGEPLDQAKELEKLNSIEPLDQAREPKKLNLTEEPLEQAREPKKLNFTRKYTTKKPTTPQNLRQSPPIRDFILHDDELNDYEKAAEEEADKAEDVQISNDGNKKFFSKDNTGSGIFIKKIKVRKGGVAIAGPGGIATAGSGGTAIVGPNGWAYTQPNSLAIAGSGTKVVAVEPTVNLEELINGNRTHPIRRGQGHVPPRVGKVVAVGPVVYYNKG